MNGLSAKNLLHALLGTLVLLQLTGCANAVRWEGPPVAYSVSSAQAPEQAQAASIAQSMLGAPYKWGGSTPNGFDCSGLVQYSYQRAGLQAPRTSHAQYSAAEHVSLRDARVGDLVFFDFDRKPVSHVGIYLGNGRFVHAPSRGKRVEIASLQEARYRKHFVTAGRL